MSLIEVSIFRGGAVVGGKQRSYTLSVKQAQFGAEMFDKPYLHEQVQVRGAVYDNETWQSCNPFFSLDKLFSCIANFFFTTFVLHLQFVDYLYSKDNELWDRTYDTVRDSMDQPLCNYWIASSHNT